jgi:hypothetical protein
VSLPSSARRPGLRTCVCGHDVLDVVDSDTHEQLILDPDPTPDGTVTVLAVGPVVTARRHGQPVARGRREHQCTALSLDDLVDHDVDPGIEQAGGWRAP